MSPSEATGQGLVATAGAAFHRLTPLLQIFHPEIMVLARPIEVDIAFAHGIESAFHADRADIDMPDDHRRHDDTDDGMPELRILLLLDRGERGGKRGAEPTVDQGEGVGEHGELERKQ